MRILEDGSRSSRDREKLRVLHVLATLQRGGIELCLLNLMRHMQQPEFEAVVAYHGEADPATLERFRDLGADTCQLPWPRNPWRHYSAVAALLRNRGPFDVIHTHLNYPGLFMHPAAAAGVQVRVAHSHMTATLMTPGPLAGGYVRLTNRLLLGRATHFIGVSEAAGAGLFGRDWSERRNALILPCGIDPVPFQPGQPTVTRRDLGIPDSALVLVQVGRFAAEKNHVFSLRILRELLEREPEAYLVLVGSGQLEPDLRRSVDETGLAGSMVFAGHREDVPAILLGAADLLLLPSLSEGMPLTVIEAQAAAVPALVSSVVPEQSCYVPGLVHRLATALGPQAWAEAALAAVHASRPGRHEAMSLLAESQFTVQHTAGVLARIYRQAEP